MLEINARVRIPDDELKWTFVRSGGPGGQNVNKVASKAVLRWTVAVSPSLPDEVKLRLCSQQARRISADGDLILTSQRFRDQERNRQDCLDKLYELVRQATVRPRVRKKTKPSRGAREARLREKRHRSATKARRRSGTEE
jgi:ribosome-associated protein